MCVIGKLLSVSVCSFVCFHVVKCEWHFGCFLCILFDYLQWRAECVCVCVCLQEERGQQGALATQASLTVSLPPLAPSALAEVVTRRQPAK